MNLLPKRFFRKGPTEPKVKAYFLLFPRKNPTHSWQAVAQLIFEASIYAKDGHVRLWVDSLREEELSDENLTDIRTAILAYDNSTQKLKM